MLTNTHNDVIINKNNNESRLEHMAERLVIHEGDVFGYLTAIKPINENRKTSKWIYKCKCGKEVEKNTWYIQNTKIPSCGCAVNRTFDSNDTAKLKRSKNSNYWHDDAKCNVNLVGRTIGYFKVEEKLDDIIGLKSKYLCRCICGKEKIKSQGALAYTKNMISCGCMWKKPELDETTGRLRRIYNGMKARCYNVKSDGYKRYGKRGIKICDEWLGDEGFENFYQWAIENGYDKGLTIDRIDNYGNYEPLNCRWADAYTQSNNRTVNIHVYYKGESITLSMFAKKIGINYADAYKLINEGCCYSGEYMEQLLK